MTVDIKVHLSFSSFRARCSTSAVINIKPNVAAEFNQLILFLCKEFWFGFTVAAARVCVCVRVSVWSWHARVVYSTVNRSVKGCFRHVPVLKSKPCFDKPSVHREYWTSLGAESWLIFDLYPQVLAYRKEQQPVNNFLAVNPCFCCEMRHFAIIVSRRAGGLYLDAF